MPFCDVASYQKGRFFEGIRIFYETHGHGPIRILLIAGFACDNAFWGPQVGHLTQITIDNKPKDDAEMKDSRTGHGEIARNNSIQICTFDNRGIGQSSVPSDKSYYTTTIMAKDALSLLEHLEWTSVHVIGHSMGAMIACKLACIAPDRISSLALLNVTGGGFQCIPKVDWTIISIIFRFMRANTPEARAAVDLDTHYTKEFLEAYVGNVKRRTILHQEYVRKSSGSGMQQNSGAFGHMNACWTHKISSEEFDIICSSGILTSVIHSRDDIVAQIRYARRIARRMHPLARMIELDGGHLVTHERSDEVNKILVEHIEYSEFSMRKEWTSSSPIEAGCENETVLSPQTSEGNENHLITSLQSIRALLTIILIFLHTLWEYLKLLSVCLRTKRIASVKSSTCDQVVTSSENVNTTWKVNVH